MRHIFRLTGILCLLLVSARMPAFGADASSYATSSAMSSGKWVKVKVETAGIQRISDADLRKMGFSSPENVKVYGYGGRQLAEGIGNCHYDDLPRIPSVRDANGLLFFGVDFFDWTTSTSGTSTYKHTMNHYSEASYYFLSDRDGESVSISKVDMKAAGMSPTVTTFVSRQVYEKDLVAPSTTGRLLLGEDFRSTTSRTFNFDLPDNSDGAARITWMFGLNVVSGTSTVSLSANGKALSSAFGDELASNSRSENFVRFCSSTKDAENVGEKLTLKIDHSASGLTTLARLDYIEVEYNRALKMRDNQLYFYGIFRNNNVLSVEGVTTGTRIWDVTDRTNPKEVEFDMVNGNAILKPGLGYKEFVAFNPGVANILITEGTGVSNQDIHSLPVPDLVIITPEEFSAQAERVAELHRRVDGMTVHVVYPQMVYNEFSSGNPDVTAFRKMLKMWYDRDSSKMKYCLLFGRPTYDNKLATPTVRESNYPRMLIWQSDRAYSESTSYSTDDYVGMLEDCSPSEFVISNARINVAVGRVPAKNVTEAEAYVSKLEKYVEQPDFGKWRNQVMVIADDGDYGDHMNQAQDVISLMKKSGSGRHYTYERLYLDAYPLSYTGTGATYTQPREKMFQRLNDGVMLIDYIGHASPTGWGHEGLLTWTDIQNLTNTRWPVIYAATCEFARWDADDVSGAEEMLLNPTAGAIALICPSRSVYITQNGVLNSATAKGFFNKDSQGGGLRIGEIMINGKNNLGRGEDNKLKYCLLGDPAMRLPVPSYSVEVTEIGGRSIEATDDMPEIKAKEKVALKGVVNNPDGSKATDFNGVVEISLYDAEAVVETLGQGSNGEVLIYNDRSVRLVNTSTLVKDGEWSLVMLMPSEISNNYSPALISCYAYDPSDAKEGHGSTEQLYVHGSLETDSEDVKGPEIEKFYLNTDDFRDGGAVNANPLVYARVSDESGINLSDFGIGHRIMLTLDDDKVYDDVNTFYSPDPEDVTSGEFTYPLAGLSSGEHTLTLEVWDNANNSSRSTLKFNVGAALPPVIYSLTTDCNPAKEAVVFSLRTDRPLEKLSCEIEVYDLSGRRIWSVTKEEVTDMGSTILAKWDLTDKAGVRVPRGIYLYRATVTTPEGTYAGKSEKLAVSAQ